MRDSFLSFVILIVFSLNLCGCAPRGETKSLDQILEGAKTRYQEGSATGNLNAEISSALTSITSNMNALEQGAKKSAEAIASNLEALERHAGYTSRPSITELIGQYRSLAAATEASGNAAAAKLLVARTYNLLASELETTRFGIN